MPDLRPAAPRSSRSPRALRRLLGGLAAAGLVVATLAGCSTSGQEATGVGGYASGDGSITLIAPGDRKPAPDLSGSLLAGGQTSLATEAGKVVVLNVWASWCPPCRKEAADLTAAADKLSDVAFLGINTRDDTSNAEAFVRAKQVPYPSLVDQDGSLVLDLSRVVPMPGLPITLVLDKQHRVAATIYGPTTTITLTTLARSLERES